MEAPASLNRQTGFSKLLRLKYCYAFQGFAMKIAEAVASQKFWVFRGFVFQQVYWISM
jgi:hypothetical protein